MAIRLIFPVVIGFTPTIALAQHEHQSSTTQPSSAPEAKPFAFFIWPEPAKLDGPIATDRPGYSDTAFLVPRGHTQLEIGFLFSHDTEGDTNTKTHTLPVASLRVGLLDDFELRVKWGGMSLVDGYAPFTTPGGRNITKQDHVDGATDMSVGFKAPILKHTDTNCLPNVSMVPSLSLPVGTDTKTSGDVDPTFELAWNYPITSKLTINGVGSIASISDSEGRFAQASGSFAGCYAITDKLSFFVEYFGIYPNTRHSDCQHDIDLGPVILITDNIQLDFAVGMGLNEEAPDFFTNMGVSFRF
jgi:hypothetical protein